jgi:hypothetical protein
VIGAILFGLGFRARSGKDTAAAEIKKQRGTEYKIDIIPFAKPLKEEVNKLAIEAGGMKNLFLPNYCFPKKGYVVTLPEWVVYDENPDMTDPYCVLGKQRKLLQWFGSDFRRADNEMYWIDRHDEAVAKSDADIILVPDMRFENEMAYIKESGETVRVDRDSLPPATHISETALANVSDEDWSLILENNGSLEEFLLGAVTAFDELLLNFPQQRSVRQALGV